MIERHKKLLRNYTQNIDTLERVAGIENLIECHGKFFSKFFYLFFIPPAIIIILNFWSGSFATATCTMCGHKVSSHEIKDTIFAQNIPYCSKCTRSETGGM